MSDLASELKGAVVKRQGVDVEVARQGLTPDLVQKAIDRIRHTHICNVCGRQYHAEYRQLACPYCTAIAIQVAMAAAARRMANRVYDEVVHEALYGDGLS